MPQPSSLAAISSVQIGILVPRAAAVLPATGSQNLFLNTGPVLLTGLIGIVTTACDATACTVRPYIGITGTTDIAAASGSVASAVVGTFLTITGVFATAMTIVIPTVPQALSTMGHGLMIGQIMWPGTLNLGIATSATNVGAIQWNCFYVPLAPGAVVNAV
jgi:hypothetical protein